MLSQAVLIAAVIDLIGVNIRGGGWGVEGCRSGLCKVTLLCTQASHFAFRFVFQTEIAKRLNAILAQIMPFLSQEVSVPYFPTRQDGCVDAVLILSRALYSLCTYFGLKPDVDWSVCG